MYNGSVKLTLSEIAELYETVTDVENVQRDDDGHIIAFVYKKYYGTTKRSGKKIHVSLKSTKELKKAAATYLPEKDFFEQLADHASEVTDVRLCAEKIYRYTLDGRKYKTDKPNVKKLFDFMPFADFKRITNQRFYGRDDMLRNGYFSGLIGTHDANIRRYVAHQDEYDVFDVDFNAAYPYCFDLALPCDRFYTAAQWDAVKDKFAAYTKFYQIRVKHIKNSFGIFVPPPPYVEYQDFDFLLQKNNPNMIVSSERLALIRRVYGRESYLLIREYFCPVKIYAKLSNFAHWLFEQEKAEKAAGNTIQAGHLKIARNSLVGNFGRRDEMRHIETLRVIDSGVMPDVITIQWSQPEYKMQLNYLPLAMYVNDITARRLLELMTDKNALRLCYNTDGGVVALRKDTRIITSERMGKLKAKKIENPVFYYTTQLYARPLIFDAMTGNVFNSKSIYYNKDIDGFYYSEIIHLNTRRGFVSYVNEYPVPVEPYKGFNLRESEMLIRANDSELYRKLLKVHKNDPLENEMLTDTAREFERLCNPFDDLYCNVRHAPDGDDYYVDFVQPSLLGEKFFKKIT